MMLSEKTISNVNNIPIVVKSQSMYMFQMLNRGVLI